MSQEQAKNAASTFDKVITSIFVEPDVPIGEVDYMSERNKRQILSWNSGILEKVESCIHEVIQDQVSLRPNTEAVYAWDGNFSYQELDQAASQLANYLTQLGIGPEVRVPLCFDKSVRIALITQAWS